MGRQLGLEATPELLDTLIQITTDVGQALRTALIEPIAPFESDGQTHIVQLQECHIALRLRQQPVQDLEELLSPLGLAVESDQQRLRRPATLGSPGRVENGLIDHGTQGIACRQHVLGRYIRLAHAILEPADLLNTLATHTLDIRVGDLSAHASRENQQRHGSLHDGIASGGNEFADARPRGTRVSHGWRSGQRLRSRRCTGLRRSRLRCSRATSGSGSQDRRVIRRERVVRRRRSRHRSAPNRPELERQSGELSGLMDGDPAGGL